MRVTFMFRSSDRARQSYRPLPVGVKSRLRAKWSAGVKRAFYGGIDPCLSGSEDTPVLPGTLPAARAVEAPRAEAGNRAAQSAGREGAMSGIKLVAVILIVLGILGLMYGKFSYTKDTHTAKLGPIDLS